MSGIRLRIAVLTGLFALPATLASGQNPPVRSVTKLDGKATEPGAAPFGDGESLTFSGEYLGMSVGEVLMTVEKNAEFNGKPAIHLKAVSKTGRKFSTFVYRFQGTGDSWIDPTGLYSLGFVTDQQSSSAADMQEWELDNEKGIASRHRIKKKDGATKEGERDWPLATTHVQDSMSMVYFFRAFPLKVGSKLESEVFEPSTKKVWTLTVDVLAEEKVKVPAGTFTTYKVRPEASRDGVKSDKGEMIVWITKDERKLPVKIAAVSGYGTMNAVLTKFTEGTR